MSTPPAFADESPRSYLIRLSEANGYPSSQPLIQLLGETPQYVVTAGWDYEHLSSVLGQACELPLGFGYRMPGKQARECGLLLGHRIQTRHLGLNKSRICVECVLELGYVPASWDLKAFLACPVHGLLLLKHCPACGARIKHRRPGLLTCLCGADFRNASHEPAPAPLTALCEVLDAVVRRDGSRLLQAHGLGMPVEHLVKMDLAVLLKVIVGMATAIRALSEWCGTLRPYSELIEAVPDVAIAFTEWPHKFRALCKSWQEHPHNFLGDEGFQERFCWLFTRLHKNFGERRSQTTFMLEAAAAYGSRGWEDRPFFSRNREIDRTLIPEARFGSANAAAKLLGVDQVTVGRWAAKGKLPAVRCSKGGKKPFWRIDLDEVRRLSQVQYERMSCREASAHLGISYSSMRALFDAGLFPNRQRIGDHAPCVAREDLEEFFRGLVAKCLVPSADVELMSAAKLLRRSPPTRHPGVVASLQQGQIRLYCADAQDFKSLMVEAPAKPTTPLKRGKSKPVEGWITIAETSRKFGLHRYEARAIFLWVGVRRPRRFTRARTDRILEFLNRHHLVRKIADRNGVLALQLIRELRRLRPKVLVSIEPGRGYERCNAFFVQVDDLSYADGVARRLASRLA